MEKNTAVIVHPLKQLTQFSLKGTSVAKFKYSKCSVVPKDKSNISRCNENLFVLRDSNYTLSCHQAILTPHKLHVKLIMQCKNKINTEFRA